MLVPLPPRQRFRFTIPGMRGIGGVRGERDPIGREFCSRPTRRRFRRIGDIRGGRRIQNVYALIFGLAAIMDVSVNVGFDPRARSDDFPEFL